MITDTPFFRNVTDIALAQENEKLLREIWLEIFSCSCAMPPSEEKYEMRMLGKIIRIELESLRQKSLKTPT